MYHIEHELEWADNFMQGETEYLMTHAFGGRSTLRSMKHCIAIFGQFSCLSTRLLPLDPIPPSSRARLTNTDGFQSIPDRPSYSQKLFS